MEKFVGKKIRTCVFISGKGSNLNHIIKNSRDYNFPAKVVLVISDDPDAKGLLIAKKNNIFCTNIKHKNKIDFEKKILKFLKKHQIKLICLAGFMRVLSKNFLQEYKHKIINIHPSLLPKYKGLNTHKRVLNKKEKYSGCTVHYVNPKIDEGRIILQKKIKIKKNETITSLKIRVLNEEHRLFSMAIRAIC